MAVNSVAASTGVARPDVATTIAISALAYVVAVALHEHAGHSATCLLLGGRVSEFGALYVECDDSTLGETSVRLVALAGPLMSLITGIVGLWLFRRLSASMKVARYFAWLVGTVGLLSAAGYPLFSGVSGLGDLGGDPDGALHGIEPEWLWRVLLTLVGIAAYAGAARVCARALDPLVPGTGRSRITYARHLALTSYLTGGAVSFLIGLLNPHGLVIVLISAVAGSLGGTSGLLWMMQWIDRNRTVEGAELAFGRRWDWITVAVIGTAAYAAWLGPTLRG